MARVKKAGYAAEYIEDAFGAGAEKLAATLKACVAAETPRILLVADANVVNHTPGLGSKIGRFVQAYGFALAGTPVVMPGGEKVKDDELASVGRVVAAAAAANLTRADLLLAIGGGAILDVAGFAAATLRGGVGLVRMPTTVASMCEGAFSETAAVDFRGEKDFLRVPSVPAAVVVDTAFARSGLDGVWRAGFAEPVRLALAYDAKFLKRLGELAATYRQRDVAAMTEIVETAGSLRRKKGGTAFGLWAAHRLERLSGYKLPHGYAISLGIEIDLAYSKLAGGLAESTAEDVRAMLEACGALEGAGHSRHILKRVDEVLKGLGDWSAASAEPPVVLLPEPGKSVPCASVDAETMKQAVVLVQ